MPITDNSCEMPLHLQLNHVNSKEMSRENILLPLGDGQVYDEHAFYSSPETTPCSVSSSSHRCQVVVDVDSSTMQTPFPSVRKSKHVHFSDVLIRRYDLTCTGCVHEGPGIGLDWYFTQGDALPLDDYEQSRPARRPHEKLILGPRQRIKVLTKGHGCELQTLQRICSRKHRITRSATSLSPPPQEPHTISCGRSSLSNKNVATSSVACSIQIRHSPRGHSDVRPRLCRVP